MTLQDWLADRWIRPHRIDAREVEALLALVDQDLADCAIPQLSLDRRVGIAYNASLQLALLALGAAGYRPGRERHHELALDSLRFTIRLDAETIALLQAIRRKRNIGQYERPGSASETEATEAGRLAVDLREQVIGWLQRNHPELLP